MSWQLEQKPHRHFARNPLAVVVTQLRFHPILKVDAKVADFQDAVRAHFPTFGTQMSKQVTLLAGESIEVRDEKVFLFSSPADDLTISLGVNSIALESKKYTHHRDFLAKADLAFKALEAVYRPIAPTRLGLRYVNVIKRDDVEKHLGRPTPWTDLVSDGFLKLPPGVSLDGSLFSSEVTSPVTTGVLTLRYGLLKNPSQGEHFRFDMDRYLDAGFEMSQAVGYLEGFAGDLYSLFDSMVGPILTEWMEPTDAK